MTPGSIKLEDKEDDHQRLQISSSGKQDGSLKQSSSTKVHIYESDVEKDDDDNSENEETSQVMDQFLEQRTSTQQIDDPPQHDEEQPSSPRVPLVSPRVPLVMEPTRTIKDHPISQVIDDLNKG
jgi:hypothetical protein